MRIACALVAPAPLRRSPPTRTGRLPPRAPQVRGRRRQTDFQPRLIDAIYRLLVAETESGALELPVDLREIAYVIVRLIESYTYLDLITGERPEARRAEPILRLLLR